MGTAVQLTSSGYYLDKRRGFIEETVTAKVLSSRKRREKEDRSGESQPFRE
jgi:hypothetical protein